MFGWFKKPLVELGCAHGVHARVLDEAGGMMADAYVCVDCGREKYPEVFGVAVSVRRMPLNSRGCYMVSGDSSREEREAAWTKAGEQQ